MKTNIVFLLCFLLIGCSSGFDKKCSVKRLKSGSYAVKPEDMAKISENKQSLTFPIRMAVFFDSSNKSGKWRWDWDWTKEDYEILLTIKNELKDFEVLSEMLYLSESAVNGWGLDDIRAAGARYNADVVMIVRGSPDVDSYMNSWSMLYLTVLGMWIAPGSNRDALFSAESVLWGTKNGKLYLSLEVEETGSVQKPLIYINDRQSIKIAKKKALEKLAVDFMKKIKQMAGVEEDNENTQKKEQSSTKTR